MEMEKWIRDGWQIYLNGWTQVGTTSVNYQLQGGGTVAVPLYLDSSELFNGATGVSEGHGYGLLMAALLGDKAAFDGLWFWLNENGLINNTKQYSTNTIVNGTYKYGAHAPAWAGAGSDSATVRRRVHGNGRPDRVEAVGRQHRLSRPRRHGPCKNSMRARHPVQADGALI